MGNAAICPRQTAGNRATIAVSRHPPAVLLPARSNAPIQALLVEGPLKQGGQGQCRDTEESANADSAVRPMEHRRPAQEDGLGGGGLAPLDPTLVARPQRGLEFIELAAGLLQAGIDALELTVQEMLVARTAGRNQRAILARRRILSDTLPRSPGWTGPPRTPILPVK